MKHYVTALAIILAIWTLPFIAVGISQFLPSKEAVVANSPAATCLYPSIKEMQAWCGAEVDGIWGPETQRLYIEKWNRQYGDQMALKLCPER